MKTAGTAVGTGPRRSQVTASNTASEYLFTSSRTAATLIPTTGAMNSPSRKYQARFERVSGIASRAPAIAPRPLTSSARNTYRIAEYVNSSIEILSDSKTSAIIERLKPASYTHAVGVTEQWQ